MPFVINDNSAAAPGTEGSPKGAFSRTRSVGEVPSGASGDRAGELRVIADRSGRVWGSAPVHTYGIAPCDPSRLRRVFS